MQNAKEKSVRSTKEERTFSPKGLMYEFKQIRWPKWLSKSGSPGILANTSKVILFTTCVVAFLSCGGLVVSMILRALGVM